jgi:hypothetical protein
MGSAGKTRHLYGAKIATGVKDHRASSKALLTAIELGVFGRIDDERRSNAFGLLMSLNMLIETPGGFDYTAADCIGWMKDAGFGTCRTAHLVGPDSMVVAIK